MDTTTQYILLAIALLLVIHQISFQMLLGPKKYKERVTLKAAHNALKDPVEKGEDELIPYKHHFNWHTLLNLYKMRLHRDAPDKFRDVRRMWGVDEEEYSREVLGKWKSVGAVGLSGSMFFHSADRHFLLKSLGRTFENKFLHEHFLPEYFDYVREHPDTLINKVLDVLCSFDHRFGEWIKASPSHYLVIENVAADEQEDWEMYDLKPTGYLEPYRDLLPKTVQGSGITDVLPSDKTIYMPAEDRSSLLARLRADLAFLTHLGAIDYSVLLVRLPNGTARLALIDVFWSLRSLRAKVTKAASDTAGLPQQTVTADADGYAAEVMKLVERCVKIQERATENVLVDVRE